MPVRRRGTLRFCSVVPTLSFRLIRTSNPLPDWTRPMLAIHLHDPDRQAKGYCITIALLLADAAMSDLPPYLSKLNTVKLSGGLSDVGVFD